jgi:hypothetical protein
MECQIARVNDPLTKNAMQKSHVKMNLKTKNALQNRTCKRTLRQKRTVKSLV